MGVRLMLLEELKNQLLARTFNMKDMIFRYEDNPFLLNTYIDYIVNEFNKNLIKVNSLSEVIDIENNVFDDTTNNVYLLSTDNFEVNLNNTLTGKLIVRCKKTIDENKDYIIDFPKLMEWQIEDYMKMLLPGLDVNQIKWLCSITKYDINRLYLESKKLSIFDNKEQQVIFNQLNDDNIYEDLNNLTIFNFTNSIIRRNLNGSADVLRDIKNIDVEPTGLVTILYKNFKNILNIQLNSSATPENLGMSPKQFNAVKYNIHKYSKDELINIFNILTEIDYKLKSGLLENDRIIDYLITHIM